VRNLDLQECREWIEVGCGAGDIELEEVAQQGHGVGVVEAVVGSCCCG
jgi:hypothetical protein